jgi:hypothetical protein
MSTFLRRIIASSFYLLVFTIAHSKAQTTRHEYKGFNFAVAGGLAGGEVATGITSGNGSPGKLSAFGPSTTLDFKIGSAVHKNWLMHLSLTGYFLNKPRIQYGTSATKEKVDELKVKEHFFGGGVTGIFPSTGAFFSGNIGMGIISVYDSKLDRRGKTDPGVSFQIKTGINVFNRSRLGWSFGASYGKTMAKDGNDRWNTNRIGASLGLVFD